MLSGAAALMYEIVWIRQFSQVLGASGYAVTVILAAFMAGLGLGAWFWGKKADHCKTYQLIKIYILLEIGIGVYAIVLPFILGYMENIYVWFYVLESNILNFNIIKFVLSIFLLVVPATFIGGTLPILSRFIIRRKLKISFKISHLYAVNTIGAILGTLTAGYIFLPNLGIKATTSIAVAVNFLVAAGFWLANRVNKYNIDSVFTEAV
jgi:spermidine synthase